MRVFYLSSSAFSDNQMSLLRHLGKLYEITYAVIIPVANSNYTKEELGDFCREQDIQYRSYPLTRRFRHPANIATYWKIIGDIRAAQPDIVYFANFDQPYLNTLARRQRMRLIVARRTIRAVPVYPSCGKRSPSN